MVKKAAVEKYKTAAESTTREELIELISQDEKKYSSDDVAEIVNALNATPTVTDSKTITAPVKSDIPRFEEWRVEKKPIKSKNGKRIVRVEFEKLKKLRDDVVISEDEAANLNYGAAHSPINNPIIMYLLPGQEPEPIENDND